ncbi:MAG: SDR family oxidoreductase, partial [Flammeovirgaceae bacterium]
MKKVAILGSTGMLGQPVTQAFIRAGFEVSVLVRNPDKATAMFSADVRIIKGDIKDTTSLKEILTGQEALYLNLSVEQSSGIKDFQAERDGLKNILQVAKTTNISRIGYLSSLVQFYKGTNWWVFDIKNEAVQNIKKSGLMYSIFYPSTFMESFDKGAYRQGNSINLAGTSKYPMYLISGADYGK